MTNKLYTQSDMEALRERCAKVAEPAMDSCPCVVCEVKREAAERIRALTLHPEGQKP